MYYKRTSLLIPVLLFVVVILQSCAVNPVTGRRQLMLMSERQEIRMGADYDPQIIAAFGEYENDDMLALIREKGQEMGLISHRPSLEYHFRILDSPVINAFAVPGGYIYLTRGILAQFNNEAELIGVIGHEMGHITARHTARRYSQQTLGQLLFIGGMVASEDFRKYGEYAMAGMQLLFLSFSREDEREADRLGVEYTAKLGYDAARMADFYQVLVRMDLAREQGGVPTWLSTHPDPGDRYKAVIRDAEKWKEELGNDSWEVNRDGYLNMLEGMVYGEDPRQGYTDGNTFYHPELRFSFPYPAGWRLENQPTQVLLAPDDGKAMMIFTFARGGTLDEAARNTMEQLQVDVASQTSGTVNGLPFIDVASVQRPADGSSGQELRIISRFIDYDGNYYVFHAVSASGDFAGYTGSFESVINNFNRLSDQSRINVQPKRVRIVEVKTGGTLSQALLSHGVRQEDMESFAFLNNMDLQDKVTAGTRIKIVR